MLTSRFLALLNHFYPFPQRGAFSITAVIEKNTASDEILDDLKETLLSLRFFKHQEEDREAAHAFAALEREQRNAIIREQDEAYEVAERVLPLCQRTASYYQTGLRYS